MKLPMLSTAREDLPPTPMSGVAPASPPANSPRSEAVRREREPSNRAGRHSVLLPSATAPFSNETYRGLEMSIIAFIWNSPR